MCLFGGLNFGLGYKEDLSNENRNFENFAHISSSHSYIGEKVNKQQSFTRKLQTPTSEEYSTKASYLLVQGLVTYNPRVYSCSPEFLLLFLYISLNLSVIEGILLLISVPPPIQQTQLMLALVSFDKV